MYRRTHIYIKYTCRTVHTYTPQYSIYCDRRWRKRTWVEQTRTKCSTNWKVPLVWYASLVHLLRSQLAGARARIHINVQVTVCESKNTTKTKKKKERKIEREREGRAKEKRVYTIWSKSLSFDTLLRHFCWMATRLNFQCAVFGLRSSFVVYICHKRSLNARTQNITQAFYLLPRALWVNYKTFITNRHCLFISTD